MTKYCGNCGTEVKSDFCTKCGTKVGEECKESGVNEYFHEKLVSKKNHNAYRISVGILMIILGFCVFIAGVCYNEIDSDVIVDSIALALVAPGIFTIAGGIFSIISKNYNILLLISAICHVLSGIFNAIGIANISLLFILNMVFAIINIIYYIGANKNINKLKN